MRWPSLLWHMPGKLWAGMMRAGTLSLWLTAGAGMAWTALTACLVVMFRNALTPDHAFWVIISSLGVVFLAIGAMAGQEISLGISRQGVNLNVGRDDARPVAEVTTTTTVTAGKEPE